MEKITFKDIDLLILESLTNIDLKDQTSSEIDDLSAPISDFLDNEEKKKNSDINNFSKIKNVLTNPDEKKVKDGEIKNSQKQLQIIRQLKNNWNLKKDELIKMQQQQKQDVLNKEKSLEMLSQKINKSDLNQNQENSDLNNILRQFVKEIYEKYDSLPIITRTYPTIEKMKNPIKEVGNSMPPSIQQPPVLPAPTPVQKKPLKVRFEKSTNPFEVLFSERGFKIGNTRLSFEIIEDALSKNFILTLDGGNGLVLDAVRMQKILKYKDRV